MMRWLVGVLGSLVLIVFALFVMRETAGVVTLASTLHPGLGRGVLIFLLVVYACCIGVPVVLFLRLREPLIPPSEADTEAVGRHLDRLSRRLSRNPHLGALPVGADRTSIERALSALDGLANEHITREASVVFLSTAISQSGRLDGLLVLVAQSRMIWTVAHVYAQRPGLREMVWLYANVGATVFAAQAVEDLDLGEVLEPMVAPVLATAAGGGTVVLAPLATLVGDALLQGTANALLTLRVGCITKRYCRGLPLPDRRLVRRSATREAAGMLGGVIAAHAGAVTAAIWGSGKRLLAERGKATVRQAARLAAGGALGIAVYDAVRRAVSAVLGSDEPASSAGAASPSSAEG
jgi:hypothetical protein